MDCSDWGETGQRKHSQGQNTCQFYIKFSLKLCKDCNYKECLGALTPQSPVK